MTAPALDDLTDELFRKIAKYVYEKCRINLTDKKRELVKARLGKVIRTRGFANFHAYYDYMLQDETGEALREVMNAVSTNLTSFFREDKHFQYMDTTMLPELIAQKRAQGRTRLRGWSAGCSSGEEIYTIAITLAEAFGDWSGWDIRLLASDIDTEVVAHGARGIYAEKRIETVPKPLLRKYFSPAQTPGYWAVSPKLRQIIAFRHLNLMNPWPFKGRFDFIFCRNVMIYFDRETQESLVNRFYQALEPGGHLFIGHSEGLSGVKHQFKYVLPTVYRKS